MPETKLSPEARRELTLRALRGENRAALAREFGVSRNHVYGLINEALDDPMQKVIDTHNEWRFRSEVFRDHYVPGEKALED